MQLHLIISNMGLGVIGLRESIREIRRPNFWRDCLVDFYVTFFLMFIIMLLIADVGKPHNSLIIGLVAGMCVFANIEAYGHVQWATMNPVAAVVFMFTKRISFLKCFFYILIDLVACVCAAYSMKLLLPEKVANGYHAVHQMKGMSGAQAMTLEWILVTAHQSTILGALDGKTRSVMIPGLAIGMATFVGITAGFPFTGGILNPFVVVAPAILGGDFSSQWIYWVGDFLGGFTALLFYHFTVYNKGFFAIPPPEEPEDKEAATKDALLETHGFVSDKAKQQETFENGDFQLKDREIEVKMSNI